MKRHGRPQILAIIFLILFYFFSFGECESSFLLKSFKVSFFFWKSYILKRGRSFWERKFLEEGEDQRGVFGGEAKGRKARERERGRNDHKVKGGRRKRCEKKR